MSFLQTTVCLSQLRERKKTASNTSKCIGPPRCLGMKKKVSLHCFYAKKLAFQLLLQLELIWYITTLTRSISNFNLTNLPKIGLFWLPKGFLLFSPRGRIKNPFVRTGGFSINKWSCVHAGRPKACPQPAGSSARRPASHKVVWCRWK